MDANIKALLHVQNALLASLCSTHQDPTRLNTVFSWYLGKLEDVLQSTGEVLPHVNAWAKTFRQHIPATPPEPTSEV